MQTRNRWLVLLLAAVLLLGYFWCKHRSSDVPAPPDAPATRQTPPQTQNETPGTVDALTKETVVVPYVKKNGRLPAYYITKQEARQQGWIAAEGNLCEVLPGRAIGGDHFSNREKTLPAKSGRKWFEADINYHCGRRNADRLLFSNDGLVFVTKDHYKTFEEK